jgi:Zn-dependent peptidase ImmA (M78 family)
MVRAVPPSQTHFGAIKVIERVTERELIRRARELAKQTRREIDEDELQPDDFGGIAHKYGITLCWEQLPNNNPGCYSKAEKKIALNPRVQLPERLNFTFDHELMHDRIEHNDDLLSLLADAHIESSENTMERLCDAGAAELLMPSDDVQAMVREYGFSTGIIPTLCQRYSASSIAVAIQMVSTAVHHCYLVIAAPHYMSQADDLPMLISVEVAEPQRQLAMLYTAASPSARYWVKRGQIVPTDHPMYTAWDAGGEVVRCPANIPFGSGTRWEVEFNALYFRSKVFAFFNVSPPIDVNQMRLL